MNYYAHTHDNKDWQTIIDHSLGVASLSSNFANKFNNKDWGLLQGILHDLGKYKLLFQKYLKGEILSKTDHATIGSLYAIDKFDFIGNILSYIIAGHHSGLPDYYHNEGIGGSLQARLNKEDNIISLNEIIPKIETKILDNIKQPTSKPNINKQENIHVWIRMLYSCLVDADYLDTEKYMSNTHRDNYEKIKSLYDKFYKYMNKFTDNCTQSDINKLRMSVLNNCIEAGKNSTNNIYTLTVPTGLGKTKSSMAFAMECAKKNNKDRIIIGIPFVSIIEQTAEDYKKIFGNNVLEHHSSVELNYKDRLASENWNAPIIVTTNVQLFESLFASKNSKCRKLHNVCNSVIILDEAHQIPSEYLNPILKYLKCLVNDFNCTLVLSSATQPYLTNQKYFNGFENTIEIIKSPNKLTKLTNRTKVDWPKNYNHRYSWHEIANELKEYKQVLCIVNTRNNCKDLHSLMPEGTYHLSSYMCPAHRSKIIKEIKQKLKDNEKVRVMSTQLIECGVDIDFPTVYRELSGLDNIAQANGRSNREGKLPFGYVKVFRSIKDAPSGMLRKSQNTMIDFAYNNEPNFKNDSINKYFDLLSYNTKSFDEFNICDLLEKEAYECKIQFRTADHEFKLIKNNFNVLTKYDGGDKIISELRFGFKTKKLLRKAQKYSVSIYENEFNYLKELCYIEEINNVWCQKVDIYNKEIGFCEPQDIFSNNSLFV